MRIWKLTPVSTDSRDWELSTYRGEVIVRAQDEQEARQLAMMQFTIAAKRILGQTTTLNPWEDAALVACEMIRTHDYEETGSAVILSPRP